MKILWVNHASFVIQSSGTNLICDPWLEGKAFDNSWALTSPTVFQYKDFENISHIWFSHEHPDHFSPPCLKKIPEASRKKIEVLYQPSKDKKVIQFCNRLGFRSVEANAPIAFSGGEMILQQMHHGDSCLYFREGEQSLLNLNDCNTNKDLLHSLKERFGKITVLVSQFSYANFVGNKDDKSSKEKAAERTLKKLIEQCEILQPEYIIPAASFVWFCHSENFHMNDSVNLIGDVVKKIQKKGNWKPIVLYPGDTWTVGEAHNFEDSIRKYEEDRKLIQKAELVPVKTVAPDLLLAKGNKFIKQLSQKNPTVRLKLIPTTKIRVLDHDKTYELSAAHGFRESKSNEWDAKLYSDALAFAFDFEFGGETLFVNGRFETPSQEHFERFMALFKIALENNRGHQYPTVSRVLRNALGNLRSHPSASAKKAA